jgi:hypothetical protein
MLIKCTVALIGAIAFASPALAQNSFQGSGYLPQWSNAAPAPRGSNSRRVPAVTQGRKTDASSAFGSATSRSLPSNHVIVGGEDHGTDSLSYRGGAPWDRVGGGVDHW